MKLKDSYLHTLLYDFEKRELTPNYRNSDISIKNLTVDDLIKLSVVVLKSEYGEYVPECLLPARCLEILYSRAAELTLKN